MDQDGRGHTGDLIQPDDSWGRDIDMLNVHLGALSIANVYEFRPINLLQCVEFDSPKHENSPGPLPDPGA